MMLSAGDRVQVMCNFYETATVIAVSDTGAYVDNGGEVIHWNFELLRKL
jgi:hypothetical protein